MSGAHPGSIQARVGAALAGIELNTEQQDPAGIKNFTDLLVDYVSCYFEDNPMEAATLKKLEEFDWDSASEGQAMAWLRERRRLCLQILRRANLFGYQGAPPIGNADALTAALEST